MPRKAKPDMGAPGSEEAKAGQPAPEEAKPGQPPIEPPAPEGTEPGRPDIEVSDPKEAGSTQPRTKQAAPPKECLKSQAAYIGPEDTPDGDALDEGALDEEVSDGDALDGDAPEDFEYAPRPGRRALRVLGLVLGWFVMVAFFVLLLVAAVSWFLYRSVTLADLPAVSPAFAGQALQETDFDWNLPVVGPLRRHFTMADRFEAAAAAASAGENKEDVPAMAPPEEPQMLGQVDSVSPPLRLPEDMDSRLEIVVAGSGEPVFLGSGGEFSGFVFPENGTYDAYLTLSQGEEGEGEPDLSEPQGHYTYHFRFTLSARPQIALSSDPVTEGSVLRVGITGLIGDVSPMVTGELGSASFVRLGSGWAAYLALPQTFTAGEFTMEILYGDTRETVTVHAAYRQTQELDTFTADGSAAIPYLGSAPENVRALFEIADPEIYWAEQGFMQPVQGRPVRNYGVVEYTDRIVDKELLALDPALEEYNKTIPGRRSVNVTFATRPGAEILAPADGRVVFAGLAGGSRCVVIEHGCGLKSLFYLLGRIDVSEGDYVSQGALLGTAQGHTICEVRLGSSPINPWEVWGNYGGLAPAQ